MNAMRLTAPRIARQATRTVSTDIRPAFLPKQYQKSVKKDWLSDPSTYPIIIIMGSALTFMIGMGVHALTTYKDVRIDPTKRNSTLRTWGNEDSKSLAGRAIEWNSWQKTAPEGMGVDHQAWLDGKKEYQNNQGK